MNPFETGPGLEQVALQPYQQRVISEATELATRIKALEAFIAKGSPGASSEERAAIFDQLSGMNKYREALFSRTVIWAREGKVVPPGAGLTVTTELIKNPALRAELEALLASLPDGWFEDIDDPTLYADYAPGRSTLDFLCPVRYGRAVIAALLGRAPHVPDAGDSA